MCFSLVFFSGLSGLVVNQRRFFKEAEKMVAEQEPVLLLRIEAILIQIRFRCLSTPLEDRYSSGP